MNHDNVTNLNDQNERDPLGLADLPLLDPPNDGWAEVRAALEQDRSQQRGQQRSNRFAAGLAAAACLVLVAGLVVFKGEWLLPPNPGSELASSDAPLTPAVGTTAGEPDMSAQETNSVMELIAFSQGLERRLRTLRDNTASMSADSAVYLAELEDLIARVDSQLSDTPDSVDLWSQRVNLMLDIESLFQHQFEREYGKMASL